jgi:ABC-2 type transport system permease protein
MHTTALLEREVSVPEGILVRRSLSSELRALLAVAKKEWIVFRRYPSWVFALFIWPVLFPFGYIFSARALAGPDGVALPQFAGAAGTTDYVSFIALGSVLWMWLNMTLWDVGYQLRNEQMRGTLESNWLCPIWRSSILVGGSLTKLLISLAFLATTLVEFRLIFGVQLAGGHLALLLLVLLLTIPSIYGIGVGFAALVLRFKEPNAMVFLVRGIFMVFCGITYPLAVLPEWMRVISAYLPLTYAIRSARAVVLTNATLADILPDIGALLLFAIVIPILAAGAFKVIEQEARKVGSLGQY